MAEVAKVDFPRRGFSINSDSLSYGTFYPFVIDSEYLKSIVGGKEYNSCELVEPASLQHVPGSYFPPFFAGSSARGDITPDSGVYSPELARSYTSLRTLAYIPQFFSECDIQLAKLFAFVEFHLSKVKSQVDLVSSIDNRGRIHNPSCESMSNNNNGYLSDDSGVCDPESQQLLVTLNKKNKAKDNESLSLLRRLREALVGIQESMAISFRALDSLVDIHDREHDSNEGRAYFERKAAKGDRLQERINDCMESVDHTQNMIYHRLKLIDSQGKNHTESEITVNVRESSINCVTYFHILLFFVTLGFIACMCGYDYTDKWIVYLRLLRGPFLVLLFLYLYGVNMKVWALKHIDYVTIFNHKPKATPTPNYIFKVAGCFCVFFTLLVVILFLSSPFTSEIPGKIVPLVIWLSFIVFLINPFNILLRKGRFSLLLVCVRILLAPFTFVYFGDFWLADQLNSAVAILLDLQYMTCYMIANPWYGNVDTSVCTSSDNGIRPVISCLPAFWRLLQCLRCFYDTWKVKHLLNAIKYFTTFPVVVFATLFATKVPSTFDIEKLKLEDVGWILILWLISAFVHAVYTFIWDVYCDWGLWDIKNRTFFRTTLVFKYKCIYLSAIMMDLFLRFAWAIKVSLAIVWHLDSDLLYTGLIIAEIVRRFVWNFFRVEYAHVLENQHIFNIQHKN